MDNSERFTQAKRGTALVMAISIMGICLAAVAALGHHVISEYRSTHLDWRQVQALHCSASRSS